VKLKLDENLNERGRALLAAAGHEVSSAVLQGLQGTVDDALIEICRREGRGLVTLDLDFANPLRFRPADYPGIAVLRLPKRATAEDLLQTVGTLARALEGNPLGGKLWIVEKGRLRVYQDRGGNL
jgi:predicted nuclease of predicted toxin-antitoxin system